MFQKPIGIQRRTMTAIIGAALLAFVLLGCGLIIYQSSQVKSRVQDVLNPCAGMIAVSTATAVDFGLPDPAKEILGTLKSNPQILRAAIILPDGRTLASYPTNRPPLEHSFWERQDGIYLNANTADLVRSIATSDPKPAHLFIRMSLADLQTDERHTLVEISLAVGLILFVVVLLQFVLLQRWVLLPLAQLAGIAESAGRRGDYSQRMPAHGQDEFGQLGQSFNALLAAVEQREASLSRLTNFQRAILNDAAYAIISTDKTGCITSINLAGEKLIGWCAEEIISKPVLETFHLASEVAARAQQLTVKLREPVLAGFETFVAEARRGLRSEAEWTYVRKDGSHVPVLLSVSALRDDDGEIFGFLGIAVDITERKQAEEALSESQRLYEELVSSVPLGVYRLTVEDDHRFAFGYVSERFCEVTGTERDAVLADVAAVFKIIHPDDRKEFERLNDEAIRSRMAFIWEGRAVVRGQTRWLHIESRVTQRTNRPPFWTGVVLDVSARRDVEAALRQNHSLLEGALQATADGILAVSSDGKITSYNRQFVELWRVPQEILDLHNTGALAEYVLQQLNNPEAMQTRIRQFSDNSKADTFDTLEFRDGRVFERFSRPQLVEGRVVGRVWSFRDVTARHWAVNSLRESEHKFKTLFETANDAILIMNDKVFLDCNQQAEVMYGSPREKILGESPVNFSPARQADGQLSVEKAAEKIHAALNGTPQFFEWIHSRGDGTLFNAEVSLNRLELRGQTVIQAIVRDITSRKQAEAAQREAEELYRTLVNTSPDGICVLDLEGHVQFSSPRALELFYGSPGAESQPGRSAVEFVSEENREQAMELLRGAVAGKIPTNERLLMRRSDGCEFVAELNGRLLRDGLGVPRGLMVVARDVTERQRQEDELKSKNSELERFTYTVSHDLKSPLITIKGFAGALMSDLAAGRTNRLAEDLKRVILAADKMTELLNGLLELSRIGRIVNPPTNISMSKLAEDVVELLSGSIKQRSAKVTVQPNLPAVYGDPQRLQEVLQNLVENALKFPAAGQTPEIEIGYKNTGDQTAFFVRDSGRGIDARYHETIFGLFNKLDTRSEGTGIGLALVRRIVEYHSGTIWVESAGLGQGATFYFTLPTRKALSTAT